MTSAMADTISLTSNLGARFELGPETIRKYEKGNESMLALADVVRVKALTLGGGGVLERVLP